MSESKRSSPEAIHDAALKPFKVRSSNEPHRWRPVSETIAELQQQRDKLPHGDRARAIRRRLVEAAKEHAAMLPGRDEWTVFFLREIVPVYNSIASVDRMCIECGRKYARGDGRTDKSDKCERCAANARQRGKQKVGKGLSTEETARRRDVARRKRLAGPHFDAHRDCPMKRGESCEIFDRIMQGQLPAHAWAAVQQGQKARRKKA